MSRTTEFVVLRLKRPNIVKDLLCTIFIAACSCLSLRVYMKAKRITGTGDCIADLHITRETKKVCVCVCGGAVVFLTMIGYDSGSVRAGCQEQQHPANTHTHTYTHTTELHHIFTEQLTFKLLCLNVPCILLTVFLLLSSTFLLSSLSFYFLCAFFPNLNHYYVHVCTMYFWYNNSISVS